MRSFVFVFVFLLFDVFGSFEPNFDQNYMVSWGANHVLSLNQGQQIQLSMDATSGSGFVSKMTYGSGFFNMMIKVPAKDTAGVVTAYYMSSMGDRHDEVDFEFLGNREGKPYTLQTNVYANGIGGREQRLHLWFDPTTNFHDYKILWNQQQIVFYVDNIPIRVYKNKRNIGVDYPSKPMKVVASLWQADWATDGGHTKTNWSYAPFNAKFQSFDINGCHLQSLNDQLCVSSDHYWWNQERFWQLDPIGQRQYQNVKKKYMIYDYCTDTERYPKPLLECPQ